jgi:hypothetical protein
MTEGLYIIKPIGRFGNHLITIFNAIYLCKKFGLRWVKLDENFQKFDKWIDIVNGITYSKKPEELDESRLKNISGFGVFHLSHFQGDYKILDYQVYKNIHQLYFPIITKNVIPDRFKVNIRTNDDPNKTLYSHLKCTDNLIKDLNVKYNILPIQLYLKIMVDYDFDKLVITTDNPNNRFLQVLDINLKKIGKRLEIVMNDMYQDFMIFVNAKYIVMDLSTFTWEAHMVSEKKQKVFIWDQFFTRFLAKYKHYVDILVFPEEDLKEYCQFKLPGFPDCGDWTAHDTDIQQVYNWDSNKIIWLNRDQYRHWKVEKFSDSISSSPQTIQSNTSSRNQIDGSSGGNSSAGGGNQNIDTYKNTNLTKKIALIGPGIMPIPPTGWGAVEILIWEYYQELLRLGWDVDIINTKNTDEIIDKVNKGNYNFCSFAL